MNSPSANSKNRWILAACLGVLSFDAYCHITKTDRLAILNAAIGYVRPDTSTPTSNTAPTQPTADEVPASQPCQRTATGWNCNVSPATTDF